MNEMILARGVSRRQLVLERMRAMEPSYRAIIRPGGETMQASNNRIQCLDTHPVQDSW
jgi:hypothetical protein